MDPNYEVALILASMSQGQQTSQVYSHPQEAYEDQRIDTATRQSNLQIPSPVDITMTNTVEDAEDVDVKSSGNNEIPPENEIDGAMAETIISAPNMMSVRKSRRLAKPSTIDVDDELDASPVRPVVPASKSVSG